MNLACRFANVDRILENHMMYTKINGRGKLTEDLRLAGPLSSTAAEEDGSLRVIG